MSGEHGSCSITHTRVYYLIANGEEYHPGKYAHLLCLGRPSEGGPAICDEWPPDFTPEWYGTGSYKEACVARDLPLCPRCHNVLVPVNFLKMDVRTYPTKP